jgi:tRNA A37 threonylcarbamoyladenosine biosynthesis protein TsaE
MDLYRIETVGELSELGWEEMAASSAIALVEWPERAGDLLPDDRWEIELALPEGEPELRTVSVSRFGKPFHLPGFPVSLNGETEGV